MDMVLKVVINDGETIIVDGFDEIIFYDEYPYNCDKDSGYCWHRDRYEDLVNNLVKYNFIGIKRANPSDELKYRNLKFAFKNDNFEENKLLLLKTSSVNMIFKMY